MIKLNLFYRVVSVVNCIFLVFLSTSVVGDNEVYGQVSKMQKVFTPLQESGARILKIYTDHFEVNSPEKTESISPATAELVQREAAVFFSLYDNVIQEAAITMPGAGSAACVKALARLKLKLVEPLRNQTQSKLEVRVGYSNNFAFSFLAVSQGVSRTLMNKDCK